MLAGEGLASALRRTRTWCRVVPSPEPRELVELPLIQTLLDGGGAGRARAAAVSR